MTVSEQTAFYSMCGSFVLGGLGLCVTILKMVYDHRERRSHFRQSVYAKQVEAYTEIAEAARKVYLSRPIRVVFDSEDERQDAINGQSEALVAFFRAVDKWQVFIPSALQKAAIEF